MPPMKFDDVTNKLEDKEDFRYKRQCKTWKKTNLKRLYKEWMSRKQNVKIGYT